VILLNKAAHEIPTDREFDFIVSIGVIQHSLNQIRLLGLRCGRCVPAAG
jgi:hypothetical protein